VLPSQPSSTSVHNKYGYIIIQCKYRLYNIFTASDKSWRQSSLALTNAKAWLPFNNWKLVHSSTVRIYWLTQYMAQKGERGHMAQVWVVQRGALGDLKSWPCLRQCFSKCSYKSYSKLSAKLYDPIQNLFPACFQLWKATSWKNHIPLHV
jgi:hypothetical protein